jgi:parallel beta-helix repeat protein
MRMKNVVKIMGVLLALVLSSGLLYGQTLTIEQAVASLIANEPSNAADADLIIGDREITQAIQLWILGQEVPGTGGLTINDQKIQGLITMWILSEPVSGQPEPSPLPPGFSLQGAIDRAETGDVIIVPKGTYRENINIDRAITLMAETIGQVIIQGNSGSATIQIITNTKDVELRNLTIQGGTVGVLMGGNTDSTIESSIISNGVVGIEINNGGTALLNNSIIQNQSDIGIFLDTQAEATLTQNTIRNSGYGIMIQGNAKATLRKNLIEGNSDAGLYVLETLDVQVSDNTIRDNGDSGVRAEATSRLELSENSITGNGNGGVYLSDNTEIALLTGNTIDQNTNFGVFGSNDVQAELKNNEITNTKSNSSGQNGEGILMEGDIELDLFDNTSSENAGSGVDIRLNSRLEAGGNTISNNTGFGIFMDGSTTILCEAQNLIFGNLQPTSSGVPGSCLS